MCYKNTDPLRSLTDIAFLGQSGVLYYLLHLESDSIHYLLRNTYGVNNIPTQGIPQGEIMGSVGSWPMPIHDEDRKRLMAVGSDGSHLHLAIYVKDKPIEIDDIPFGFLELIKPENAIDPNKAMSLGGSVLSVK